MKDNNYYYKKVEELYKELFIENSEIKIIK